MTGTVHLSCRDHLILARALTCAISLIDVLARDLRALSDQGDMKEMLEGLIESDSTLAHYQGQAQRSVAAAFEATATA